MPQKFTDGDPDIIASLEHEVLDVREATPFSAIAGLTTAKKLLEEAVRLPLQFPNWFTGVRRAWKGVLLFGPPGTGKTMLARAVATECKTTFFNCKISSILSKWVGESSKRINTLFRMARFYGPSTIFFDEVDSIGGSREEKDNNALLQMKSELLTCMEGIGSSSADSEGNKQVVVLAATNYPWKLDEALRRRF